MAAVTWKNISAPTRDTSGTETALKALSGAGASFQKAAKVFEDRETKVRTDERNVATESARAAYRDATTPEQIAELNLQYSPQNTAGQNIDTTAVGKMAEGATSALRQRITAGQQFEQQQALRSGQDELARVALEQKLNLQPGAGTIAEQEQEANIIRSRGAVPAAGLETDIKLNQLQAQTDALPLQRETDQVNAEIALVKSRGKQERLSQSEQNLNDQELVRAREIKRTLWAANKDQTLTDTYNASVDPVTGEVDLGVYTEAVLEAGGSLTDVDTYLSATDNIMTRPSRKAHAAQMKRREQAAPAYKIIDNIQDPEERASATILIEKALIRGIDPKRIVERAIKATDPYDNWWVEFTEKDFNPIFNR